MLKIFYHSVSFLVFFILKILKISHTVVKFCAFDTRSERGGEFSSSGEFQHGGVAVISPNRSRQTLSFSLAPANRFGISNAYRRHHRHRRQRRASRIPSNETMRARPGGFLSGYTCYCATVVLYTHSHNVPYILYTTNMYVRMYKHVCIHSNVYHRVTRRIPESQRVAS